MRVSFVDTLSETPDLNSLYQYGPFGYTYIINDGVFFYIVIPQFDRCDFLFCFIVFIIDLLLTVIVSKVT